SWVSNAKGNKYDVFISPLTQLGNSAPIQLTHSDDDAMHPRMTCDEKGRIWITYYKWHKRGLVSRDKEVYLRRLENGKLSQEIQISPTDVPWYEDHTEPAISTYGSGAVIAWSWDFHPPNKGYSNQGQTPTIFMRAISSNLNLGNISRVSEKKIEVTPSLITGKNKQVWFAWDSLDRNQRKSLCVGNPDIGRNYPVDEIRSLDKPVMNVCSPCFAKGPNGELSLLWSETENGSKWVLKRADLDVENNWSTATIKTSDNPRFCSAAYDSRANVWVAYSAMTKKGREIVVDNLRKSLPSPPSELTKNDTPSGNTRATNKLLYAIDQKYSYRDIRGVDWDKTFDTFTPKLNRCRTPEQFAQITVKMLSRARDAHIWVKLNDKKIPGGFKRKTKSNYSVTLLSKIVPQWKKRNKIISSGRFDNDIGYILISSWSRHDKQMQKAAYQALRELSDTKALIVDVRPNGGGAEPLAQDFAGCFIDKSVVYAKHVYPNRRQDPDGWGNIQERILKPNPDMPRYQGQVVVLMGPTNMSSCDAFLLMMKQVPNCVLIGEKSYGSSGNPKPHDLGNGVVVFLPSWKALRADGTCFEGEGIMPDVPIRTSNAQIHKSDRVLETALKLLRRHGN
ncbi:hypothetical protein LCGC14_1779800, partial [marine sediment metagenome]